MHIFVPSFFSDRFTLLRGEGGICVSNFTILQPLQMSDVQILLFFREIDVNRVDGLLSTLDGLGTPVNTLPNAT